MAKTVSKLLHPFGRYRGFSQPLSQKSWIFRITAINREKNMKATSKLNTLSDSLIQVLEEASTSSLSSDPFTPKFWGENANPIEKRVSANTFSIAVLERVKIEEKQKYRYTKMNTSFPTRSTATFYQRSKAP